MGNVVLNKLENIDGGVRKASKKRVLESMRDKEDKKFRNSISKKMLLDLVNVRDENSIIWEASRWMNSVTGYNTQCKLSRE